MIENLLCDKYMDDCLCSFRDVQEALSTKCHLEKTFQRGGFKIMTWLFSSKEFLSEIPEELKHMSSKDMDTTNLKVLDLTWYANSAIFCF